MAALQKAGRYARLWRAARWPLISTLEACVAQKARTTFSFRDDGSGLVACGCF